MPESITCIILTLEKIIVEAITKYYLNPILKTIKQTVMQKHRTKN